MIFGVGTDIIAVSRVKDAVKRQGDRFLEKLFTVKERAYFAIHKTPEVHYAGRFAAKEAIAKALGTGFSEGVSWLDIEILNDPSGKPVVFLSGKAKELCAELEIHLSISHCESYATAFALISR